MTPQAKDLALLRTLPLFSSLSEQTFNKLAESIRFDRYVKGDTIVRQGEKANWVMVVLEGFVKLTRLSPNGEETLIHIFGRGDTFAVFVARAGRHAYDDGGSRRPDAHRAPASPRGGAGGARGAGTGAGDPA